MMIREMWFLLRRTLQEVSIPSGYMRNPTAVCRIFMPRCVVWMRMGISTMIIKYTSAHNGQRKRWLASEAGKLPRLYARQTSKRHQRTAWLY